MIDKQLIRSAVSLDTEEYEQVRVNHEGCPAGEDTRRRLYVKKVSGGLIAYCHNCGDHGYVRRDAYGIKEIESWLEGEKKKIEEITPFYELPSDLLWPDRITYWPMRARMHIGVAFDYRTFADPGNALIQRTYAAQDSGSILNGMVYTINRDDDGNIIGYQTRWCEDGAPKNIRSYGDKQFILKSRDGFKTRVTFIVEDVLSGVALAHDYPMATVVALCGTHLSMTERVAAEIRGKEMVVVYLDPDDAGKMAAPDVVGSCKLLNKNVTNWTGTWKEYKHIRMFSGEQPLFRAQASKLFEE